MLDNYPVRYTAFIDILGFRELISELDSDPGLLQSVCEIVKKLHQPPKFYREFYPGSDFRVATISDAIAMSAAPTPAGLGHVAAATTYIAQTLLGLGYFVRGALVKDRLYHSRDMVLGAGLVRAYFFESTVAVFPRIVLTKEVVADLAKYRRSDDCMHYDLDFKKRSSDGPHFLHILRPLERGVRQPKPESRRRYIEKVTPIRDIVQTKLDQAVDNPSHYKKVHWFANYFNETFYGVGEVMKLDAPGLEMTLVIG